MLPANLKPDDFNDYPPEARTLVVAHLKALQELPLSFLPSLLREIADYDYKFPAEQNDIDSELANISSLSSDHLHEWFGSFAEFTIPATLEQFDWVNQPAQFTEQLSAYLWTTHQLDSFRAAATEYGNRLRAAIPPKTLQLQRLGITVIGQGVDSYNAPLFRNLRKHGTYFNQINPENGLDLLLATAAGRASAHPAPYDHWYVDGGSSTEHTPMLTCISYQSLEPARAALLKNIQAEIAKPGMGPEELRTHLARLTPADIGMSDGKNGKADAVLDRFQLKLLTEGSGTQIFSTTFAQWTAREVLRRAQATTLLVRFAPRQRQAPMNELLAHVQASPQLDPTGSLIDAEMAAYYQWINQQRLPGSEHSAFVAWFENHRQAVAIGPTLPRGAESSSALNLTQLVSLALG